MKRALVVAVVVFGLWMGASEARPAPRDQITITMLAFTTSEPGYQAVIANFERAYPSITVNPTYVPTTPVLFQLEATELAAGNGPDILATYPGCGTPVSVCTLAKESDLAPLVREPWVRWSLPLVTSLGKYGQGLYAFEPNLSPWGMFTNDALFAKLGLKVPQTFAQLLSVCRQAKADGTVAVLLNGGGTGPLSMIDDIAVATVYGPDPHWAAERRAGAVSFDGSPGWHQALQRFIDLNDAGCFEPGMTGVVTTPLPDFAQGGGLMAPTLATAKGTLDTFNPHFPYSFHPFPGGTVPGQTETDIQLGISMSVNAHVSPANQAAAQTFINFVARPAQNALYAQVIGGLTQYEFLKQEVPTFMQPTASVIADDAYAINPVNTWWNADVYAALLQDAVGLVTGQTSIVGVLSAMDAGWQQGAS